MIMVKYLIEPVVRAGEATFIVHHAHGEVGRVYVQVERYTPHHYQPVHKKDVQEYWVERNT